ncbi:MAG: PaaX family transcriptional regulator C-terminal domain-containing protein [Patescibacteria group bacterium]|nr:PaaX family transcriptional regulator C-terminal domain-containing protein [Patescibacteria group bacterium]
MNLKSAIAYILRDGRGMNQNALLEILKSVFGTTQAELQTALMEMKSKKEISFDNDLYKTTARSRRRIPKAEKVKYVIPLWHRRWTMVVFHVAEEEKQMRDQIRYQLKKEGFAVWQHSIWVSPHGVSDSLRRFVENHGLESQVKIFQGALSSRDETELIKSVWNTNVLEKTYQSFIKEGKRQFARLKSMHLEEDLRTKALDLLAKDTELKYLKTVKDDPKLPRPFLSKNWLGFRAYNIYQQLDKYLK